MLTAKHRRFIMPRVPDAPPKWRKPVAHPKLLEEPKKATDKGKPAKKGK
jgi:hypothetical protein